MPEFLATHLNLESYTVRTKTDTEHTPTIAAQATSRQCLDTRPGHPASGLHLTGGNVKRSRSAAVSVGAAG